MNNISYFISDLHLKPAKNEFDQQNYFSFVELIKQKFFEENVLNIFILGDLFDFWWEYTYYIPKHFFELLLLLRELRLKGKQIYYFAGNHDFYLGNFFKDFIGMNVINDSLEIKLNDKTYYMTHGDGLAKSDTGYRILKKILRNKFNQKLFKIIHPDLSMKIALLLSKTSRQVNYKNFEKFDHTEYIEWAIDFLKSKDDIDNIIIGHTHKELIKPLGKDKIFINLGPWLFERKYYVLEEDRIYSFTYKKWRDDES